MAKQYVRNTWINDAPPAINETNLNNVESGVETNNRLDLSILVTPPADADYTLTTAENQYGRIEVDTSNWATSHNIIMNDDEHTFLAVVNTTGSQNATFKTSAGTGILVISGTDKAKKLRNNTVDVIEFEGSQTSSQVYIQSVYSQKQTKQTSSASIPHDNTIPQNTEGFEITDLATTITPTNASNRLRIQAVINFSDAATNDQTVFALFQDSIADALAVNVTTSFGINGPITATIIYEMVAGTTSATTFKIRAGGQGTTTNINGGGTGDTFGTTLTSSMTVTEIGV